MGSVAILEMIKTLKQVASVVGALVVVWYVSVNYDRLKTLAAK
jgi:hypothetical protein